MEALQAAFAELARTVEGYIAQHSCSWCGGPFNGGNYLGCSSVGSGNKDTNRILEELLRTLKPNSPVGEHEGSDDYTKVPFDDDKILRQHYTAHVTPPPLAYRPSLPFSTTMEPAYVLLMRDEVISTTPARENDKLIKSSIDDLVPIPRESKVILDSNLECNKV
ncbi:hypothetical protein Tco_1294591 [Tanacetum coccineum]